MGNTELKADQSEMDSIPGSNEKVITFVLIACGHEYIAMANDLLVSMKSLAEDSYKVVVLSDDPSRVDLKSSKNVTVVSIPKLEWPEASLLRFEIIAKHSKIFVTDYLIYLDVDTLILDSFNVSELKLDTFRIFFVHHPGTYNRNLLRNIVKRFVLPSWETNRKSKSFVPWNRRRIYVYGAIFGGETQSILKLCNELSSRSRSDIDNNFYPISYDESHLNWWVAHSSENFVILTPRFAFVEEYPWLNKIENPKILIISKPQELVMVKNALEKNRNRSNS
jgi:hypothetical protein